MTAKDAVFLLERTGLKAKIEGYGMVTHQSLNPGEEVVRGKSIQIKLN
jgi:cell division protein FtsI (penicillin-binding protein 3)